VSINQHNKTYAYYYIPPTVVDRGGIECSNLRMATQTQLPKILN